LETPIAFALPQANLAENNRAAVKSCPTCSADAAANPLDKLATLGRRTQNNPLLPVKHSVFKGFPIELVSSATGELAFATTDLAFQDNPLLLFQRTYNSSRNEDSGLGRGWSFVFNDSITLGDDSAVLTTSTGDKFVYRRAEAKRYVLQTSEAADVQEFQLENGGVISSANGDITRIYKRSGSTFYLSEIKAPAGFEVSIKRSSNGKVTVISSVSGEINLVWSKGDNAKLLAVTDSAGRRISFGQSSGSLQSAATATGGEWQYEYANGRLSRAVDPANRTALLAKYDASGRASEFGDAVGTNRLVYELNAENISTLTTVTDSLNYARVFQQNRFGMPTAVTDKAGALLNLLYNEANRVVQMTDANGAAAILNYDTEQRLPRQSLPNGDEKTFEYNKNGKLAATTDNGERTEIAYDEANLTESRKHKNGKNVKSTFNRRGQETRLQIEGGLAIDSEYDEKGRKTAYVYSDIGRFEKTFDAAGRKTSEKTPSGFVHGYEYDANNEIVRQSDNRGRSARVERDASGNITKFVGQNTEVQVLRDEAGRITQLTNSLGQSRRYVYNSRGSLIRFVGADGRDLRFQYNERGEMQSIFNAETDALIYQRNGRGNSAKIQRSASLKNLWQMQKVSFASSFSKSMVDESCAFRDSFDMSGGGDSGWMDSWGSSGSIFMSATEVSGDGAGASCNDPFGSAGSGRGKRTKIF
jgi:YD repeat-containing protein